MARLSSVHDGLPRPAGESVWAYPRVPRIEPFTRELRVVHSGHTIARTTHGLRLLETGHPPRYFFPMDDVRTDYLVLSRGQVPTEHLGAARAFDVRVAHRRSPQAAWTHPRPPASHAALKGYVAFFAGRVDRALVDGEQVIAQPGGVFGGWVTPDLVGPYRGALDAD